MALTITLLDHGVSGNKRRNLGTLSLDSSYPSGGYPVTPRTFGLSVIDPGGLVFGQKLGYLLDYDVTAKTVRVYQPNDVALIGSQAPGDVVQLGVGNVLGKTSAGDVTAVTAGPVEVPVATNLSTLISVPWQAVGV